VTTPARSGTRSAVADLGRPRHPPAVQAQDHAQTLGGHERVVREVEGGVPDPRPQVRQVRPPEPLVLGPERGGVRVALALADRVLVVHVGQAHDPARDRLHERDGLLGGVEQQ
jgi:hypothetical protein